MLQDKSHIVAQLSSKEKVLAEEVTNLSKKQKFLEKQASDAQGHMRDIFRGVEAQQAAQAS
ncbi:hypothetical protein IE81DRAFT_350796 [Ceraceosorus guamensis]|uniref:Uncharacterized protein n=1 Tax=Ceraceosorus guamensis TaxID=1522189 RepID=A0A316VMG5_9BASI|nr:hypothetical protein IE81DRAFT_350796 [Ceraceosorus guamensis]PWN38737.1 hypothetical protein IE81DRAFT_350796 [Ceraceosorus guamensis]